MQQNKIVSSYVTAATAAAEGSEATQQQQQQQQLPQELYLELQPPAHDSQELIEQQTSAQAHYHLNSIKPELNFINSNDLALNYEEQSVVVPRQPAIEYGLPGGAIPREIHNSNQLHYAPLRAAHDRKLPLSPKTVPYPPSFISLTTNTEKPAYQPYSFYSTDFKSVMNQKLPDLFSHRSSKSLLESYIPSWEVVKHLQQYKQQQQHGQERSARNGIGSHTLAFASPFKGYIKRQTK